MHKNVHKALIRIVGYISTTKHEAYQMVQFCDGLKTCCDDIVYSGTGIGAINFNYYDEYPVLKLFLRNNLMEWVEFEVNLNKSSKIFYDLLEEYEALQVMEA